MLRSEDCLVIFGNRCRGVVYPAGNWKWETMKLGDRKEVSQKRHGGFQLSNCFEGGARFARAGDYFIKMAEYRKLPAEKSKYLVVPPYTRFAHGTLLPWIWRGESSYLQFYAPQNRQLRAKSLSRRLAKWSTLVYCPLKGP